MIGETHNRLDSVGTYPTPSAPDTYAVSSRDRTNAGAEPRSGVPVPPRQSRLLSLDGWRAVSILMVLAAHSAVTAGFPEAWRPFWKWVTDGQLGVRFFFVISGFLITWLLVIEHDRSGRVNLKHFFFRRALRILPVYLAFIAVLAAISVFTPFHQGVPTWVGNLTLTTDFVKPGSWTSAHLWSLSVEEQFYLIWPCVFVFASLASSLRRALQALAIPILLAPVFRFLSDDRWRPVMHSNLVNKYLLGTILNEFSFFNRFDALALGCVAAFLLARRGQRIQQLLGRRRVGVAVIAVGLVMGPYVLIRLHWCDVIAVPCGPSLQACGFAVLLLQSALFPGIRLYRALNRPWVVHLGVLSYSVYIWQQVFSTSPAAFGLGTAWWLSFPAWLAPTILVAVVSYFGLERPFLKFRRRFRAIPC